MNEAEAYSEKLMAQIVLVGRDWQARALLRAQLLEEGFDVQAYDTVPTANAVLESSRFLPGLLIADVSASDDPASDLETLAGWARQLPTWIIASRNFITEKNLKGRNFEMTLFKPVDLGELVQQIKHRLPA